MTGDITGVCYVLLLHLCILVFVLFGKMVSSLFFFEGGEGGSRSTPGFYLMKYIQLFTYIQTIHTFFSVYSTVGFTKFLFYLLGSCLVSF